MQRNNSPKEGGKHRHGSRENCSESETDYFYLKVSCIYVSLRSTDICHMASERASNSMSWEEFSIGKNCLYSLIGHWMDDESSRNLWETRQLELKRLFRKN